jgi:hypothetical protein
VIAQAAAARMQLRQHGRHGVELLRVIYQISPLPVLIPKQWLRFNKNQFAPLPSILTNPYN